MPNKFREIKSKGGGLFLSGVGAGLRHRTSGFSLLVWWFEQALPHTPFSPADFQVREKLNSLCLAFCMHTRMVDNTLGMVLRCFIRKGYQYVLEMCVCGCWLKGRNGPGRSSLEKERMKC